MNKGNLIAASLGVSKGVRNEKSYRMEWVIARYPAFFPLILLLLSIALIISLQPKMFVLDTLNNNMRVFLPMIYWPLAKPL